MVECLLEVLLGATVGFASAHARRQLVHERQELVRLDARQAVLQYSNTRLHGQLILNETFVRDLNLTSPKHTKRVLGSRPSFLLFICHTGNSGENFDDKAEIFARDLQTSPQNEPLLSLCFCIVWFLCSENWRWLKSPHLHSTHSSSPEALQLRCDRGARILPGTCVSFSIAHAKTVLRMHCSLGSTCALKSDHLTTTAHAHAQRKRITHLDVCADLLVGDVVEPQGGQSEHPQVVLVSHLQSNRLSTKLHSAKRLARLLTFLCNSICSPT